MITDGLEERVLFPALLSGSAASDVVQAEFAAMHVDHIAVG